MDHFYVMGRQAALEKLGGLLGSAAEAWKGLAPGTQGLAKRLGAGGAVGAAGGAALGGEGNRGTGALLGGLVGAGGMAGAGHLAQKSLRGSVGSAMLHTGRSAAKKAPGIGAGARTAKAVRKAYEPALEASSKRIFPRFVEEDAAGIMKNLPRSPVTG